MAFRDLVLNNFRWKLGALIMAMFVWFIIQIAMSVGLKSPDHALSDVRTRVFLRQPIWVLTAPDDPRAFKVTPLKVDVTLRSASSALEKLEPSDIRAFISLADAAEVPKLTKQVLLYVPSSVDVESIFLAPPAVIVERVAKPE